MSAALSLPPQSRLMQDAPLLTQMGAILALVAIPFALLLQIDGRMIDNELIWLKPLKFAVALSLYCLTLAWAARYLPPRIREARWMGRFLAVVVTSIAVEQLWVTTAAALGLRSHFNDSEPFLIFIYPVMGLTAVLLTSAAAVFGWFILRHGWSEVERAIGWSFLATFVLTVPIAMALADMPVHAEGLPPFGWTLGPGDMRPAHFMATHAMQIVPLATLALTQLMPLRYGTGLVLTLGWSGLTIALAAYGMGVL